MSDKKMAPGGTMKLLAVLLAGSFAISAAYAEADRRNEKGGQATAAAPAAGNPKVSPYVIANRQHVEAAAADREHSMKRTPGQSSLKAKPVHAKGKRH